MSSKTLRSPRSKPEDPQAEPVINDPYQPPQWYWQLNENAIALKGAATAGRRPAQNTPVAPSANAKTKGLGQAGMIGAVFPALTLVNEIRAAVRHWQEGEHFAGATETTRRLLEYWTDLDSPDRAEQSDLQPYFAQLDAVLTHIYLQEIQPQPLLQQLAEINKKYNAKINRICHKMATGTGKTLAMAMLLLWQAANHRRRPEDLRFTNRFLLLTPGITVKERLQASLDPQSIRSDFHTFPIAPPGQNWAEAISHIRVHTANWQQFEPHVEPGAPSGWAKNLLQGGSQPLTAEEQNRRQENPEDIIRRLAEKGRNDSDRILVFNDESHHCHRGDPDKPNQVETKWFQGLKLIHDADQLLYAADFSATPTYIAQDNPRPVDWIVSDYSLLDALEAGLVKIPQLPTAQENSQPRPEYRDLYANSPAKDRNQFDPDRADRNQLLKQALQDLYIDYEKVDCQWQTEHQKLQSRAPAPRPVMAVIMNRVDTANRLFEYIAENKLADRMPLLSNVLNPADPPNTIIVHSQLEAAESETKAPKAMAQAIARLAERYRYHYHFPEKDSPEAILRQVMNTVGRPGQPGANVRCVVSVDMLTEGWDTKTVTHLLGFRRFGTSLLCEQAAGRTLRRVHHDLRPDGRFPPEHAVIIGIPYAQYSNSENKKTCSQCAQPPEECICPARPETVHVEPRPDYIAFLMEWPNILRLERENKISSLRLQPAANPEDLCPVEALPKSQTTIIGPVGPEVTLENGRPAASRQRFLYAIAEQTVHLVKEKFQAELKEESGELSLMTRTLFADALAAAKTLQKTGWIPEQSPTGTWYPADEASIAQAAQWLFRAIDCLRPSAPAGQPAMAPIPARNSPWLSTADLKPYDIAPAPELIYGPTRKSHISYAHCDSTWETKVARQLDKMPEVKCWVRNRRLNWYIPYVEDGQPRRYYPDFLATADLPDGLELNIVIEVKGEEDDQDRLKKRWTEDYWLPAINSHQEYGAQAGKVWSYLYLDSPTLVDQVDQTLSEHIAHHAAEHQLPAETVK